MRRSVVRIRGLGFIIWHTRHLFYHISVGLVWAWILREIWQSFQPRWIILSILASGLPDIDHFVYFYTYGKKDQYSKLVKQFIANREWRMLWLALENGHKSNTNLATHNYFTMGFLLLLSIASFFYEWQSGIIFFGAMLFHYIFDILDDLLILGSVNPNWKRLGANKRIG